MKIKYWLLTDTHFGHNNLVKKGYRPEGFEEQILENMSVIGENDFVFHLGDFAFYDVGKWSSIFMNHCKARGKFLMLGNHDKNTITWYYNRGWNVVCKSMTIHMYGYEIIFSHIPLPIDTLNQCEPNTINVHGHVHNTNHRNASVCDKHKAVYLEHEYKPIQLKDILGM